jgi:6-phosphogluconate dehydrogenase
MYMQIGLFGLGKMGFNLGLNMMDKGHQVVAYDVTEAAVSKFEQAGGGGARSTKELVEKLQSPKVIWLMVPAGSIVDQILSDLEPILGEGDIVIDGGNSHYKDTLRRYDQLKKKGIHYIDCGTSGGTEGAREGACLMIGGDEKAFLYIEPLIRDIAIKNGYLYTGAAGSGHFLKMVHNGVEYGMMQAIGEGFEVLEKSQFNYDYEQVARVWNNGSVIRSWLMEQ